MFDELLAHPVFQAAIAPFIAALVVAVLLRRSRLLGLAIPAAFLTVVALTIGFALEPLTATRKMVLVGLAASALVLPLAWAPVSCPARAVLAGAAGLAAAWVVLRVLQQQGMLTMLLWGVATAIYLATLVDGIHVLRNDAVRAASASLALGLGAAALAIFGASAFLAQTGVALAAGAGALLLVLMLAGATPAPAATLALPAAVVAGLVCLLAVFTGALHWAAVLPLLAVPWAARRIASAPRPPWQAALYSSLGALVPVALACALAWRA